MWVRLDYSYSSSWWNSIGNVAENDSFGLIPSWSQTNLQVGLQLPSDWTFTAFVNNLTDERNIFGRLDNRYASDWFGVDTWRQLDSVSRPRHYGVSVRKRF